MKRRVRSAADQVARLCGLLARRERETSQGVTVLTYHRVLSDERSVDYPFPSLAMPLSAFRAQMRWLSARGDVLPLARALAHEARPRANSARSSRPVFALTFDDGYEDSHAIAADVLEEFGLRGTFFVTTGFVGTRELMWFDKSALLFSGVDPSVRDQIVTRVCGASVLDRCPPRQSNGAAWTAFLKSRRPEERRAVLSSLELAAGGPPAVDGFQAMSIADVVDLHRRGHEIGSHTVSHALLPTLDDAELRREIEEARDVLAIWLGTVVPGFCYPNGDHDERVIRAVAQAGHTYACTTRDGIYHAEGDPFRIPRVDIVRDRITDSSRRFDATAFRRELCGLYRRRARARVTG